MYMIPFVAALLLAQAEPSGSGAVGNETAGSETSGGDASTSDTVGPFEYSARGYIQNDFRFVVGKPKANGQTSSQWIRNETSIFGQLNLSLGSHVQGVASLRPVLSLLSQPGTNQTQISKFEDLLDRNKLGPLWFEFDNAYIQLSDLLVDGLELRLGQQVVVWGTGDFFNPTNNINSRDFYDPLQFGRPMGNQMAMLRYSGALPINFQLIYIPVFRPARLPPEALAGFSTDVLPLADPLDRRDLRELNEFQQSLSGFGTITNRVEPYPTLPRSDLSQGNYAAKVGASLGDIDVSLSYLYGRWDLPVGQQVDPIVTIAPGAVDTVTRVKLVYPRMHVIGFDFSTSIAALGGLGLWGEAALFIPNEVNLVINHPDLLKLLQPQLPCVGPKGCAVVRGRPFLKATVGFDYSFTKYVYLNAQYLYGFVDEFGADFVQHYAVVTTDLKPFGDEVFVRFVGVFNLNDASIVAYPVVVAKLYTAVEMQLGALLFLGDPTQKFGKPEVGNSQIFARARLSF